MDFPHRWHIYLSNIKMSEVSHSPLPPLTSLSAPAVIRGDKKSRSCPICHKAFRSHAEMTHHVISHAREKQLSGPLTVAGEQGEGVVLLDPSHLGFQVRGGGVQVWC